MRSCLLAVSALLLGACHPRGVAIPVDRLEGPAEAVAFEDVVSGSLAVAEFDVVNRGAGTSVARLEVDEPFFLSRSTVTISPGGTARVQVGLRSPGYDTLYATVQVIGVYDRITVPLQATFDLDADDDGFLANDGGGSDCDDRDAAVHPASEEVCDDVDNDCNGFVDDDAADQGLWYQDVDGDGYGDDRTFVGQCERPPGAIGVSGDCDDTDPGIHPAATETWYDGVDQDCDRRSDYDRDRDGFDHFLHGGSDCRDTNPGVHPGADETWYDGIDQDCDAASDYDQDGDGSDAAAHGGDDCDDLDPERGPGAPEVDDGLDQDCDGMADEDFLVRGDLLLTELLLDPRATPADGQFVELYNASSRSVDLAGLRLDTVVLPPRVLEPGDLAVVCGSTDPTQNGGIDCVAALPGVLGTSDSLVLSAETVLDEVDWTGWAIPAGASLELDAGSLDPDANDAEAAWCPATEDLGSGDLGTPGALGAACD